MKQLDMKMPKDLETLKELQATAEAEGAETYTFKGHDILTKYGKYLIQYIENEYDSKQDYKKAIQANRTAENINDDMICYIKAKMRHTDLISLYEG